MREKLKALRLELGLTQKEAARAVGVTGAAWNSWERGRHLCRRPLERIELLLRQAAERKAPTPTREQIKGLRLELGLTQKEASHAVGVHPSAWSYWERVGPCTHSLERIELLLREAAESKAAESKAAESKAPTPTREQIKGLRLELGLTQKEAARAVGVTGAAWGHWERGMYTCPHSLERIELLLREAAR